MPADNRILTSGNQFLEVTNLQGSATTAQLVGVPLGTATGGATGELGAKVIVVGNTSSGSGAAAVTLNTVTLGASGSQTIPAGAKGWGVTILTGTGTVKGAAVPAGLSVSDANTIAASFTVTTDNPGTAFVYWNT